MVGPCFSPLNTTALARHGAQSTERDAWMAGRKVERALAAKAKRRDAHTGKSTPATPEEAVLEATGTALSLRRVPGPCGTHLRFDPLTGRATVVPALAPAPYLSPAGVTAEESFLGEEVHAALRPVASVLDARGQQRSDLKQRTGGLGG